MHRWLHGLLHIKILLKKGAVLKFDINKGIVIGGYKAVLQKERSYETELEKKHLMKGSDSEQNLIKFFLPERVL